MKSLLRELGSAFIILFALNTTPGQAQMAMTQHGLTLSGPATHPIINNASGKDLLGYVLEVNGELYPELFTAHVRRNTPVQTAISFDRLTASPREPAGQHSSAPVLHAVVFADGEYVGRTADDAEMFPFLAIAMEAEKGLGSILSAARHDATKQVDAWAKIYAFSAVPTAAETQDIDNGFRRGTQHIIARDLIATKQRQGDAAAFDMADRIAKLPSVWRNAEAPPTGLARLLRELFAPVLAQGSYGTWFPQTYAGDDIYGPITFYAGQNVPVSVGTRAQCSSPSGAYAKWVGLYWPANYPITCPNGSTVNAYSIWPGEVNQSTYYLSGRWELDIPPAGGVGQSAAPQAWWTAYNWCGRYAQWPSTVHSSYCNYGCDGSAYQCGGTW